MGKKKGGRGGELGGLAAALVKAGIADEKSGHSARDDRSRERRELGSDEVSRREAERTVERVDAKLSRDQTSRDRQLDLAKIGDIEQARQEKQILGRDDIRSLAGNAGRAGGLDLDGEEAF